MCILFDIVSSTVIACGLDNFLKDEKILNWDNYVLFYLQKTHINNLGERPLNFQGEGAWVFFFSEKIISGPNFIEKNDIKDANI